MLNILLCFNCHSKVVTRYGDAFKGVQKEKDKNLTSKVGGEGKIDIAHLAGVGVFVLLAAAFAFGLITMEDLKELIKVFLKTQ